MGSNSQTLRLFAPVDGLLRPIERVPDPVFSSKTVGPGLAVDPLSETVLAPATGTITQFHKSHHAFTITTEEGADVLVHVGLDTVQLRGEGFTPLAKLGAQVKAGDPVLRFDADLVARKAKSLLTLIVITNGNAAGALELAGPGPVKAGSPLASFPLASLLVPAKAAANASAQEWLKSDPIVITADSGLHARPAAELAATAKKFKSETRLVKGAKTANLRSLSAVLGLEVGEGETISLEARGPDAKSALAALGQILHAAPVAPKSTAAAPTPSPKAIIPPRTDGNLAGVMASPGSTDGLIFQLRTGGGKLEEAGQGTAQEWPKLEAAMAAAREELSALSKNAGNKKDTAATIFAAHLELLDDPELEEISRRYLDRQKSAAFAWRAAYESVASQLAALNNQLLAARASDVRDVGRRVERILSGESSEGQGFPVGSVLVAEDLTPSDVAGLDRNVVRGLCTTTGGTTSHVAILARSLDLPALVGVDESVLRLPNGTPVILDANHGLLRLNPSQAEREALRATQGRREAKKKEDLAQADKPAITTDGHRVEIVANVKGAAEAKTSVGLGGEGVGLLRTEFLFLGRNEAPTEEEQEKAYRAVAEPLGKDRTLVIRTLDVGGDKPLPYLPIPKEENPFLGERGIRVSLRHPDSFRAQLRAVLRMGQTAKVNLMFPMVGAVRELIEAKKILEEERQKIGAPKIPVGVMIEVPSAALLAEHFAKEADFFSIGSNDLSQYTLAIDRGHPRLAAEVDGLDPSLLILIDRTVRAAHAYGRWVGVCGGIAGDPQAVPILLGLGVDELSVSVPSIPAIKAQVRALNKKDCEALAQKALSLSCAAEVRALVPMEDQ